MKRKKEFVSSQDDKEIKLETPNEEPQDNSTTASQCRNSIVYSLQEYYCKSYMHRDVCSHIFVSTANDFLITASVDGHIKFWKILSYSETSCGELEFVKDFRAHIGATSCLEMNKDGKFLVSLSKEDKSLKVFHILSFDMICMLRLNFVPGALAFTNCSNEYLVISSQNEGGSLYVYETNSYTLLYVDKRVHKSPVTVLAGHSVGLLSIDNSGFIEYSTVGPSEISQVKEPLVEFTSKLDTDLFVFLDRDRHRVEGNAVSAKFSPDGNMFAICLNSGQVLLFKSKTCCIVAIVKSVETDGSSLGEVEKARRKTVEEDFLRHGGYFSVDFDESCDKLFYPTIFGIQILKIGDKGAVSHLGTVGLHESLRFTGVATWAEKPRITNNVDRLRDRRVFALAWRKNRFYIFINATSSMDYERRDECNDRPGMLTGNQAQKNNVEENTDQKDRKLPTGATIHTTFGDVHVQLFPRECPKTVENFCGLASSGYYNGNIFHRVIRQFMIQTGDPMGTGAGGQSIWGNDFEDEIHDSLKHDKPYTLSMANAGPNTNGSQFFITVVSCPWLDGKHTIFGRVTKGMDVVHKINNLKTDKQDKPLDEVKILSVSLK